MMHARFFWTGELFVLEALFLHRNPGHNVKTTLIKTSVKVKVKTNHVEPDSCGNGNSRIQCLSQDAISGYSFFFI